MATRKTKTENKRIARAAMRAAKAAAPPPAPIGRKAKRAAAQAKKA